MAAHLAQSRFVSCVPVAFDGGDKATALNVFELVLTNENVGRESEAPAELSWAANMPTNAYERWAAGPGRLRRSVALPRSTSSPSKLMSI
jgi:hypothetical protein